MAGEATRTSEFGSTVASTVWLGAVPGGSVAVTVQGGPPRPGRLGCVATQDRCREGPLALADIGVGDVSCQVKPYPLLDVRCHGFCQETGGQVPDSSPRTTVQLHGCCVGVVDGVV